MEVSEKFNLWDSAHNLKVELEFDPMDAEKVRLALAEFLSSTKFIRRSCSVQVTND